MKKRKWFWGVLVVLLVMSIAVGGCGRTPQSSAGPKSADSQSKNGTSQTTARKPKIALLMPSLQGYVYVAKIYGFLDEAKKLGITPTVLGAGGYDKLEVQVKQVEDMIAAEVDVIVIQPLSEEGLIPAEDKAVDKGIKVLETGNVTTSKKVHARVRTDQAEIGRRLARAIGKNLNGKGNIVMFNGPAGASWSKMETEAFKEESKKYPGIKILGERWSVYDAGVAMNIMNDYLQAFPNIDYVYSAWDTYAEGAARAIETAGKKGQIGIVTAGLTSITVPLLKEGVVQYVVAANPVLEGRNILRYAVQLANGEQLPPLQFTPLSDFTAEDVKKPDVDLSGNFYPEGWVVPR